MKQCLLGFARRVLQESAGHNFVRLERTQSRASPDVQSQPGHRLQAVDTCPFLHARLIAT